MRRSGVRFPKAAPAQGPFPEKRASQMPATVPAKDPESPSIVEFISARLDEDEAAALPFGHTTWRDEETPIGVILVDGEALIEGHITGLTAHIARHDPARVLAEVKAWRRLLLESS